MFCKQTQRNIDTLLRLKEDSSLNDDSNRSNKIASIMAKPDYQRTKEEKEDLTVSVIEEMIQKGENKDFINKIASAVTSKANNNKQVGEVAEFQALLRNFT